MPRATNKATDNGVEIMEHDGDEHQISTNFDGAVAGSDDENEDLLNMEIPPLLQAVAYNERDGRLVISHIEVENFKSYFGKQLIGPFHKCFTSIIGPNGSGKSNVIDALLFVFGYRASKIRSKKVSVLIHSSAGREDVRSCTVTVHFCKILDKDDGCVKVNGSEITISRSAFKDNSSRYNLNGKVVKFKEISEMLRSSGIDLVHNRFLILQGEVEQISMMKPKAEKEDEEGMLEYLEDIIGSSRLKPCIVKLQKRIEQINERRALQVQRVQHAEKEKNRLEESVREMFRLMRLENEVNHLNNKILLSKRLVIKEKVLNLKEDKSQAEEELGTCQEKLAEIAREAKQISKERQQLQSMMDKCHEVVQTVGKQKAGQEQIITKTENDLRRLQNRRDKLLQDIENETNNITDLELVPERSKSKIDFFRKQIEEATAQIEEFSPILMKKFEEVRESLKKEEVEKAKLEAQLGKLTITEDSVNSDLTLAQHRLMNLQSEEEAQRQKYDTLQSELLNTEDALAKRESDLETAQVQIPELESTFAGKTSRLTYLHEQEARFSRSIRELRRKYEEKKQTEDGFRSANKLLNRIMAAKQSGEINGIFGRLGDLGAIDEKYDVAISTNFGQLDYIVTDTVETAQQCIELLKREQLGVSTFIALEKQQQYWRHLRTVPKTPENVPRLIDLIRVKDEQVLPAFYYVLSDTLVAEDIEMATHVALGTERRWRTVTLKGELIDTSGAMTGGGNVQHRSRIGRDVLVDTSNKVAEHSSPGKIVELQQELNNAEAELSNIKRQHLQLEQELEKRRDDLKRIKQSINDMKIEIESSNARIVNIRKQIEQQKQNVINATANVAEVNKAKKDIAELSARAAEIGKETDSLRTALFTLNSRMESVEEKIAGSYKERVRGAEEAKKEAETGITNETASIAANERNMKKARVRIANLEQDVKDIERQYEKCSERNTSAKDRLGELDVRLSDSKEELDEAKQKLDEYVNSVGERNDQEVDLQKRAGLLQQEVKRLYNELRISEAKLEKISTNLSKLRFYRLKQLGEALGEVEDEGVELEAGEEEALDVNRCFIPPPSYDEQQIREFRLEELETELAELEQRREKQSVNLPVVIEYLQKLDRFKAASRQLDVITDLRDRHRALHDKLKKQRLYEFMAGFQQIATLLRTTYQMITIQGDVSLELVDALDPFSEGIAFNVRPPKKSWKQIMNLSGGEKTLASLSLVFGLHHYKPTPLYVMDEIDAALDFRNVSIIGNYLLERTRNAQFIVISLRNQMYEKADRLIGIYKISDCTRNVCVDRRSVFANSRSTIDPKKIEEICA